MEVTKIDNIYIQNLLDKLVNEHGMSSELLSNLLNVDIEVIKNYKESEKDLFSDFDKFNLFTTQILMLEQISLNKPDFKLRTYLYILIDGYKLTTKSIAKFANVDEQLLVDFINDKEISIDVKYNLSSTVMSLLMIFKKIEPKFN
ncbi:HTH domain-containing protein [Faecalimicrobium sp. JNUCC 81]